MDLRWLLRACLCGERRGEEAASSMGSSLGFAPFSNLST
jgi:hypothetical protein